MMELKPLAESLATTVAMAVPKQAMNVPWRDLALGLMTVLLAILGFFAQDLPTMARDIAVIQTRMTALERAFSDYKIDNTNKRQERNQDIQNIWEELRRRR